MRENDLISRKAIPGAVTAEKFTPQGFKDTFQVIEHIFEMEANVMYTSEHLEAGWQKCHDSHAVHTVGPNGVYII
jgi:hypothetical protein